MDKELLTYVLDQAVGVVIAVFLLTRIERRLDILITSIEKFMTKLDAKDKLQEAEMVILMADVSSWQPESDSWFRQLADVGVKAVVVKLTEGTTYRNPKAAAQLAAGRRMGMQVHGYHYAHYHNSADAVAEGRFFGTTAKALGIPTESVMVADVEDPSLTGELTGLTNVFLQTVKAIGYPHTDLYTMTSWLTTRRFDRVALIPKNLWLASYGVNQPGVDNVGTWQFTNNFQGLGVDMSYDFFGHYTTRLTGTLNDGVARVPTIRFHTVQPGESWWAIAHQYGHDMDKKLAALNGKTILSVIHPGDQLRVN